MKVPARWVEAIASVSGQDDADEQLRLGEQMPHGLRLVQV
jgi:hypothetical protein